MSPTSSDSTRIDSISLNGVLPRVFLNEPVPPSEVWQSRLTFSRGETCLVEATSGAGKSSLCAFIYGLRTDYEGTILFDKTDSSTFDIPRWQALRRRNLAYLPQEPGLFPELTALENIRLKNNLTGHLAESTISEWIDLLGLSSRKDRPAGRLSVGQQQRVALIRALCQPFDFILLDEPVSHLDPENNRIAADLILSEASRQNAGIIATSVGNHILLPYSRTLKL